MEYEIYADTVFVSAAMLNYLVLSLTDRRLQGRSGSRRKITAGLLGAFIYTLCLLCPIPYIWLRILIGSLTSGFFLSLFLLDVITLNGMKRCFEELATYSLLLGGIVFCVNRFMPFKTGIISVLFLALGSYEVIRHVRDKWVCQRVRVANVLLKSGTKEMAARALMDTGNGLVEPISGKPVCVVNKELACRIWENLDDKLFRVIPFRSVGGNGILKGYVLEKLVVEYEGKQICLSDLFLAVKDGNLSGERSYDMIINPGILKEGRCGRKR